MTAPARNRFALLSRRSWRLRATAVVAPGLVGLRVLLFVGPLPQDPGYHEFADRAVVLGVPHFGDLITNLAFFLVGLHGLLVTMRPRVERRSFADPRELGATTARPRPGLRGR